MSSMPKRCFGGTAYPFFACMLRQAAILVAAAALFAGGIYAGNFATLTWPGQWFGSHTPLDQAVLGKLKSELDLTPDQVARLTPVITAACADIRLVSEENRAERLAVLDEISTSIAPDLSADQQRKLEALETELRTRPVVKRDLRVVALF